MTIADELVAGNIYEVDAVDFLISVGSDNGFAVGRCLGIGRCVGTFVGEYIGFVAVITEIF